MDAPCDPTLPLHECDYYPSENVSSHSDYDYDIERAPKFSRASLPPPF